jgi:hypothetical protein
MQRLEDLGRRPSPNPELPGLERLRHLGTAQPVAPEITATDDADTEELCITTPQHTFCFDRLRRRFRRLPLGRTSTDPTVPSEWEPYFALHADADGGGLTVSLDPAGTRRLRVLPRPSA